MRLEPSENRTRRVQQRKIRKVPKPRSAPGKQNAQSGLVFTGERIVPQADNCEPNFASRMYQEHIARYLFAAQICEGKSVIDIGCGVGYGSQRLAELGAESVHAFDLSTEAIRHARIHYSHPNIQFETANAEQFSTDRQFDIAVCFELIEHVAHPRKVLENIRKALKEDGILVMSTPRALEQKRTHFHEHEFTLDEYQSLLADYFPAIEIYVENNHFSSMVTQACPSSLRRIVCLKDQFRPSVADVFIAVATNSVTPLPKMEPVIALDSDAYVTMLERDVAILHKAEDDLKARSDAIEAQRVDQVAFKDAEIERLTGEYKDLFTRSEELSTKLWQAEQRNSELGVKDSEIERLTSENNALRDQASDLSARLQESEMKHAELQQEQKTLREELDLLKVRSADADSRRLDAYEFARISSEQANGLRRELEILRRDIGNALDRPAIAAEANFEQRHKDIVGSMERLFLGTDATHALARDPLIDRIARLVLELREQRERADHLTREIGALQEFQRHAEDWHRQLLRIRKSFSWRVTAPIRGLTRPFRRPH